MSSACTWPRWARARLRAERRDHRGTALTGNQPVSEISAYVVGTPSTIGEFVLPLTNPALAAVRVDSASCAADAREGQRKMGGPHPRGWAKRASVPIHEPAVMIGLVDRLRCGVTRGRFEESNADVLGEPESGHRSRSRRRD
jgi:hypothetical protein